MPAFRPRHNPSQAHTSKTSHSQKEKARTTGEGGSQTSQLGALYTDRQAHLGQRLPHSKINLVLTENKVPLELQAPKSHLPVRGWAVKKHLVKTHHRQPAEKPVPRNVSSAVGTTTGRTGGHLHFRVTLWSTWENHSHPQSSRAKQVGDPVSHRAVKVGPNLCSPPPLCFLSLCVSATTCTESPGKEHQPRERNEFHWRQRTGLPMQET